MSGLFFLNSGFAFRFLSPKAPGVLGLNSRGSLSKERGFSKSGFSKCGLSELSREGRLRGLSSFLD